MPTVTLSLDPRDRNYVFVASPFEAKDIIKSFPQRRWNPNKKVWVIPAHHENMAKAILRDAGFRVTGLTQVEHDLITAERRIAMLEKQLVQSHRNQPVHRNGGDPFADLNGVLPPELRGSVYKALMKVLHPDKGGSEDLAQRLNNSPLARNR